MYVSPRAVLTVTSICQEAVSSFHMSVGVDRSSAFCARRHVLRLGLDGSAGAAAVLDDADGHGLDGDGAGALVHEVDARPSTGRPAFTASGLTSNWILPGSSAAACPA